MSTPMIGYRIGIFEIVCVCNKRKSYRPETEDTQDALVCSCSEFAFQIFSSLILKVFLQVSYFMDNIKGVAPVYQ